MLRKRERECFGLFLIRIMYIHSSNYIYIVILTVRQYKLHIPVLT